MFNLIFWMAMQIMPKTFQLEMEEGRFFSSEISTDSFAMVINEQAAKNNGF